MEVFTFLRMGGARERIHVSLIANPAKDRSESKKELQVQYAAFDAAKAECFLEKDRQRLLAVVEAGFGHFGGFNTLVRDVFAEQATLDGPSLQTTVKNTKTKKKVLMAMAAQAASSSRSGEQAAADASITVEAV